MPSLRRRGGSGLARSRLGWLAGGGFRLSDRSLGADLGFPLGNLDWRRASLSFLSRLDFCASGGAGGGFLGRRLGRQFLLTASLGGESLGAGGESLLALGRPRLCRGVLESPHESLDLAGRIDDALLSRKEWVTDVAEVGPEQRFR